MNNKLIYAGTFIAVTLVIVVILNFATSNKDTINTMPASIVMSQETTTEATTTEQVVAVSPLISSHYIEIINGCGPYYDVTPCVNMRSGPGVEFPIVERLRTGIVLRVESIKLQDGHEWYKVIFDGELRYPERVNGDWYILADPESIRPFNNFGDSRSVAGVTSSTTKRIVVNLSEEMLYAYDDDSLFMKEAISTGLEFTPTPRGVFKVFYKTPSRYMQGPIPGVSDQEYDLPGVPWNLYFTYEGAVIHGAYWHDHFGEEWSHGCVNLPPQKARDLYLWADLRTLVTVVD